ncbi:MAG: S8 family serine peptidase [Clostridia bacterium]|nr:S8 family serine peptidase [Clostridia bacterium]
MNIAKKASTLTLLIVLSLVMIFTINNSALYANGNGVVPTSIESALTSQIVKEVDQKTIDEIIQVFVIVDDRSLIDESGSESSIRDYSISDKGLSLRRSMCKSQDSVLALITNEGLQYEMGYNYYTLFNGFSLKIRYCDLDSLRGIKGISEVIVSDYYTAPSAEEAEANAKNFNYSIEGYDGSGMSIAVLDTGVNYNHTAFSSYPDYVAYTNKQVEEYIEKNELQGKYINEKVPYAYDYADYDDDVIPSIYHGTHVSGICVGNDD